MGKTTRLTNNETAAWLLERDGFLLLTHRRPDGDTLGSAAGLCAALRAMGKQAYLLENPETTARYAGYVSSYVAPSDFVPQTVVTLDTADAEILQKNAMDYPARVDLAIDHHASYTEYASYTCLQADKASCGEVVYAVILAMGVAISAEIALPLYVAISTDTGRFQFSSTTADTLEIAAALVRAGADNWSVNQALFGTKTRARLAFDGRFYTSLQFHYAGRVAVAVMTQAMMDETGVTEDDLDDVASIPIQVEGVLVGIVVKELPEGGAKASVRTVQGISANAICQRFGGGGHPLAAGCSMKLTPAEMVTALLEVCEEHLT